MARPSSVNEALHQLDEADLSTEQGRRQVRDAVDFLDDVEADDGLDDHVAEIRDAAREALMQRQALPGAFDTGQAADLSPMIRQARQSAGMGPREIDETGRPLVPVDPPPQDTSAPSVEEQVEQEVEEQTGQQQDDLDAFLDEAEEDEDPFVGVPQDHRFFEPRQIGESGRPLVPVDEQGRVQSEEGRAPRYRESDMQDPFGWSESRIAQLQDRLVKAGLLEGEFRRGWYDEATGQAYGRALGLSNQRGLKVTQTIDQMTQQHAQQRQEDRREAMSQFQPDVELAPDVDTLRQRARDALVSIGRRRSEIGDDEVAAMVDILSGEYRQQRQVETERQRRLHEAAVDAEFALPGETSDPADLSDLEQVDPVSSFNEWFQSDEGFGRELETRETSSEVARRGATFEQGLNQMRGAVRAGGG